MGNFHYCWWGCVKIKTYCTTVLNLIKQTTGLNVLCTPETIFFEFMGKYNSSTSNRLDTVTILLSAAKTFLAEN